MKKLSLIVLSVVFIFSLSNYALAAKSAVMIIANNDFQDDEFLQPKMVLEANGIEVTVASNSLDEAVGMDGLKAMPDILISDIDINEYDAILLIGGYGATIFLDDPMINKIAQDTVSANKILAAICLGPVCLAKAGVLTGKNATTYPAEENQKALTDCGVNYTSADVEIDGNIITASGPSAAKKFGEAIVKALK
ncbi:MAG: DJ-1/PfpI family protein [Candidatus Omnitrophica bacterium]|nr:DJ-1/PfpI family protein [Candidatus Omnitrophota bacterium]